MRVTDYFEDTSLGHVCDPQYQEEIIFHEISRKHGWQLKSLNAVRYPYTKFKALKGHKGRRKAVLDAPDVYVEAYILCVGYPYYDENRKTWKVDCDYWEEVTAVKRRSQ